MQATPGIARTIVNMLVKVNHHIWYNRTQVVDSQTYYQYDSPPDPLEPHTLASTCSARSARLAFDTMDPSMRLP